LTAIQYERKPAIFWRAGENEITIEVQGAAGSLSQFITMGRDT